MDKVTIGIDRGLPARLVENHYRLDGDTLEHYTDGQLRARVALENAHQFVADHPEAADVVREQLPNVEAKAAEYKLARAKEYTAIRTRPLQGQSQLDIDAIVAKHVKAALERFMAQQAELLAKQAAAASSSSAA